MEHEALAEKIAAALITAGLIAYVFDNLGDSRGPYVEVITGHDEHWALNLERMP